MLSRPFPVPGVVPSVKLTASGVVAGAASSPIANFGFNNAEISSGVGMTGRTMSFGRLIRTPSVSLAISEPPAFFAVTIFCAASEGIFMSLVAMRVACTMGDFVSSMILFVCNWLKMAGVHARGIAAKMVEFHSFRDWTNPEFVGVSMGIKVLPSAISFDGEIPIPGPLFSTEPKPAAVGTEDFSLKSFLLSEPARSGLDRVRVFWCASVFSSQDRNLLRLGFVLVRPTQSLQTVDWAALYFSIEKDFC